jgi:hypothetical protein
MLSCVMLKLTVHTVTAKVLESKLQWFLPKIERSLGS